MRRRISRVAILVPLLAVAILILLAPGEARAQQQGHNLPGDLGLKSGTQAPPGVYAGFLYYAYPADSLKNDKGEDVNDRGKLTMTAPTVFVSWVTNKKFLGANIGGTVALPWFKNRISAFSLDAASDMSVSDIYLQPVNLGWHLKRADVIAGYGVYLPTGNFGGPPRETTGLGMFSHELSVGTTAYLTKDRSWHASALLAYEMHANKPGVDIKVGDIVTVEGGVGKTFVKPLENSPLPLMTTVGLAYYTQFKATTDSGADIRPALRGLKDRVFGAGPEVNVFIPQIGATIGARYVPEFGARNTTQGQTFVVSIAFVVKPLGPPPPPPEAAPDAKPAAPK